MRSAPRDLGFQEPVLMKHGESLLTFPWQKAHEEHLHQVQCTAACLGWHMAVHRRFGVSPVWAEGQVAGRSYAISP